MYDCKFICRIGVYLVVIIAVGLVLQVAAFLLLTRNGFPESSEVEQARWHLLSIGCVAAVSGVAMFRRRRKRPNPRLQLTGGVREEESEVRPTMSNADESIEAVTHRIEAAIKAEMQKHTTEEFWVTHYGANDIHPKHLVYWIVVRSDREKKRLERHAELVRKLRGFLEEFDYPPEGRAGVHIGFESQETVSRESNGNFYHHWK